MIYNVGDRIILDTGPNSPFNHWLGRQAQKGYLTVCDVLVCNPIALDINNHERCQHCSHIRYKFEEDYPVNLREIGYCDDYIQLYSKLYKIGSRKPKEFKLR